VEALAKIPQERLQSANMQIVVIGCGEWQPIKGYAGKVPRAFERWSNPSFAHMTTPHRNDGISRENICRSNSEGVSCIRDEYRELGKNTCQRKAKKLHPKQYHQWYFVKYLERSIDPSRFDRKTRESLPVGWRAHPWAR